MGKSISNASRIAGKFLIAILLICILGFVVRHPRVRHMLIPESVRIDLPNEQLGFSYRRTGVHPIQAEYSRQVKVRGSANWHPLAKNGGNSTYVNTYTCQSDGKQFVRLSDATGIHIVDPSKDSVHLVVEAGGRSYVGAVHTEDPTVVAYHASSSVDPFPRLEVQIDGEDARPLSDLVGSSPDWIYQGVICGATNNLRFYGAQEKAEQAP